MMWVTGHEPECEPGDAIHLSVSTATAARDYLIALELLLINLETRRTVSKIRYAIVEAIEAAEARARKDAA